VVANSLSRLWIGRWWNWKARVVVTEGSYPAGVGRRLTRCQGGRHAVTLLNDVARCHAHTRWTPSLPLVTVVPRRTPCRATSQLDDVTRRGRSHVSRYHAHTRWTPSLLLAAVEPRRTLCRAISQLDDVARRRRRHVSLLVTPQ